MVGNGGGVSRPMQHADNHDFRFPGKIIDGIAAEERDAQVGGELMALRAGERKVLQAGKCRADFVEQARRRGFRTVVGDIGPDFGEVGFRRVSQAEVERSANSFLPLAIIFAASNFFTRPAATSARPLSMSAFNASSS